MDTILKDNNIEIKNGFNPKRRTDPELRKKLQNPIQVKSNHLEIKHKSDIKTVFIYSLSYDPEIPSDSIFIKQSLLRKIHIQLNENYLKYIYSGDNLLSTTNLDMKIFNSAVSIGGKEYIYAITIKPSSTEVDLTKIKDKEINMLHKMFLEVLVNNMLKSNQQMKIGRAFYYKPKELNEDKHIKKINKLSIIIIKI